MEERERSNDSVREGEEERVEKCVKERELRVRTICQREKEGGKKEKRKKKREKSRREERRKRDCERRER